MHKPILAVLLAIAAVTSVAPATLASHTESYAKIPTERDDQGRSNEPDGHRTSVLGTFVENKVVDADLNGVATPDSGLPATTGAVKVIAPGCTDDSGRRPSGLCGLYTVGFTTHVGAAVNVIPARTTGVQGMSGDAAPGRFTPTKATAVRMLDAIHHAQNIVPNTGSGYYEVNRKLDDTGARSALATVDPAFGSDVLMPNSAIWAWYGKWTDLNGNGVIDSHYDLGTASLSNPPPPDAREEFTWYGNCIRFPNIAYPIAPSRGYCAYDTEKAAGGTTRMQGFLYPGNHHSFCGGTWDPLFATCVITPADIPARQAIHLLGATGVPVCQGTQVHENVAGTPVGIFCSFNIQGFDNFDGTTFGDPLLGPQDSLAPDQEFNDRGGDPRLGVRQWVYGLGWVTYFYDQSLLSSLIQVTTVGCTPNAASPNTVDLATCRFADVDAFRSLSPITETALQTVVKPAARSNWVTVRTEWNAVVNGMDGFRNNKALDANAAYGPVEDQTQNPGFSREPNEAGDSYPAATRGVCADAGQTHMGWCNSYAAHQAGFRAYGDVLVTRAVIINRPLGAGASCTLCVSGVFLTSAYAGEAPAGSPLPVLRGADDHRRTLGPGQYIFGGIFGQWRDAPQTWTEEFADATCPAEPVNARGTCGGLTGLTRRNTYTAAPDGWVGNIVNATNTFYYRGYTDEACTTDQGAGAKTFAACHPYRDGAIQNPQGYGAGRPFHQEYVGRCDGATAVTLTPADGTWNVPVFVWRGHFGGIDATNLQGTFVSQVDDKTGTSTPITLATQCATGGAAGGLGVTDLLILPLGNQGETFTSSVTARVGLETVTDVDTYHGW